MRPDLALAKRLAGASEMMDLPNADPIELEDALETLARINRFLGGVGLVLRELPPLLEGLAAPVRVLDVASGFADIPRAAVRWARRRGLPLEIECLDAHAEIRSLAERASASYPEIRFTPGDALALPYPDGSFDVVLASLILHHMEGEGPVRLLQELRRVARRAVLVNDLRRGIWPYLVTWTFLHLASRNRLIVRDGPLSVRRSYREDELEALAASAGWRNLRIARHAFFRLALVETK